MKIHHLLLTTSICLGLVGCATAPKPIYVSAVKYQAWDCDQLASEYSRLDTYLQQPSGGGLSAITSGVGIGLTGGRGGIFPSVSLDLSKTQTSGNDQKSILLGERNALIEAGRFKNCPWSRSLKSTV